MHVDVRLRTKRLKMRLFVICPSLPTVNQKWHEDGCRGI